MEEKNCNKIHNYVIIIFICTILLILSSITPVFTGQLSKRVYVGEEDGQVIIESKVYYYSCTGLQLAQGKIWIENETRAYEDLIHDDQPIWYEYTYPIFSLALILSLLCCLCGFIFLLNKNEYSFLGFIAAFGISSFLFTIIGTLYAYLEYFSYQVDVMIGYGLIFTIVGGIIIFVTLIKLIQEFENLKMIKVTNKIKNDSFFLISGIFVIAAWILNPLIMVLTGHLEAHIANHFMDMTTAKGNFIGYLSLSFGFCIFPLITGILRKEEDYRMLYVILISFGVLIISILETLLYFTL